MRQRLPGLLLGMTDGCPLERRVLQLLDRRSLWANSGRRVAALACLSVLGMGAIGTTMLSVRASSAQAAAAHWHFDVVSIHLHEKTDFVSMMGFETKPDGMTGTYVTLARFLSNAYASMHLDNDGKIINLPTWGRVDLFDIQGKLNAADAAKWQKLEPAEQSTARQQLLQQVLAERFHLKTHTERRVMPVFALVLTKGGFKISEGGPPTEHAFRGKDGKPMQFASVRYLKDRLVIQDYSLPSFAEFLSSSENGLGRPVVDKTGLAGKYSFEIEWAPAGNLLSGPDGEGSPEKTTALMTALENVGLKLEATKEPVDVLVIDQVERPTEN